MGHAESPSLISLGLATDVSQEGSSFRWGLATSGFLHALVVVMAMFLRFQSTIEEPFRAIDVALISSPEAQTPAPSKEKTSPPMPSLPKVKPMENALPPLPTQTASERLSEFLGGAVGSIVVPNKQEIDFPAIPPQFTDQNPPKDQSPLIENLRLPPTAPRLSRPERLHTTEPLTIPKTDITPLRQTTQSTMVPPEPKEPASPPQPAKVESAVKPAPALPELSSVAPFKRTEQEMKPTDFSASKNLEESLKRTIPTIPTPSPTPKFQRKPKPVPPQQEKSSVPEMSAPQLAQIHPSQPLEKPPQREKMMEIMEKLRGELKVPNLKSSPVTTLSQEPMPSSSPSTKPVQSEIDQRIAKLSIPNVTPVESIKKRLQLLEVQSTSNPASASSQSSSGKNRYLAMVEDKIDHQWVAPPLVASTPVVVLKFRISRSGEISNIHIDESSGNGHYDSAARRAVHAVNPLPPFPPDISDSFFEVRFRFIKD
jgi:TonB family protein